MTDTKKTTQSFQCRDTLWECFAQMATELECSVDYLINDAMKQYARQRGYASAAGHSGQHNAVAQPALPAVPPPQPMVDPGRRSLPASPRATSRAPLPPPAPRPAGRMSTAPPTVQRPPSRFNPVPPPEPHSPSPRPVAPVPAVSRPPARHVPPPLQRATTPELSVYYNGERFSVNKERFIIGRGRQSSDLTIKDPNVSRQHAMIEFVNGQHYIVDMGSANGLEFAGQLVQRRVINDGDVFRVCDHELRFSYG